MRIAVAGATGLVGTALTGAARSAGHDVLPLSRAHGVDLTGPSDLDLAGVDAVLDVTNAPSQDRDVATARFVAIAERLARAARAGGVPRTVLLSIIGVDRTPDDGYYGAKLAQERATLATAPGPRILRAAQFHEFAGQMLAWRRTGDRAEIPDQPVQPVELDVVVAQLLAMATAADERTDVDIAGPRVERLTELVGLLDASVTVVPVPASEAVASGALLAGPDAMIAGVDFRTWLAARR